MKRFFTCFAFALVVAAGSLSARQLSPAEALAAVSKDAPARVMAQSPVAHLNSTPVLTLGRDGARTLYVFNAADAGNGFAIVAADDVATPLLGYSDCGTFDPVSLPPQMQWWLTQYSAEIEAAIANGNGVGAYYQAPARSDRQPIAPLTATKWNQDAPFNDLCPMLTSSSGSEERSVTGCVATAMAQVMKFWNWPERGTGSNSYTYTYNSTSYSASADFAATTYHWDLMLDDYTASASTEQNLAVATLMKDCGVAVNMSYGLAATGGSGAESFKAAQALVKYFGYDRGLRYLDRQFYTYPEWVDIVYGEVSAGRPVIYGGESAEGGHEFVCDGYSTGSYFHFNWGWGGMSNGYFLLSALDPDSQGIGGSGDGYNMDQSIIVGVRRPDATASAIVPAMAFAGTFEPQQQSYTVGYGETVVFGEYDETMYYSQSVADISARLGLKLTDADSGSVSYIPCESAETTVAPQTGWYEMGVAVSEFPQGSYRVSPAFESDGEWHDVLTPINTPGYVSATNDGSTLSFTVPTATEGIEVTACVEQTPIYIGLAAEFSVTLSASADFYGEVIPALVSGSSVVATGTPKGISMNAGDTQQIDWVMTFSSSTEAEEEGEGLTAGTYQLVFISPEGASYSSEYSVTVNAEQSTTPEVSVNSITFNSTDGGDGTSQNPYVVDPENISATISLDGTQGYWADNVSGMIFNSSTGREVTTFGSHFVGVTEGQNDSFTLTGNVGSALAAGETYIFAPWGGSSHQFSDALAYIRATTPTGISSIATVATVAVYPNPAVDRIMVTTAAGAEPTVDIYSITGAKLISAKGRGVDVGSLAPGNYLVAITTDAAAAPVVKHLIVAR